jgi:hypothetical protein
VHCRQKSQAQRPLQAIRFREHPQLHRQSSYSWSLPKTRFTELSNRRLYLLLNQAARRASRPRRADQTTNLSGNKRQERAWDVASPLPCSSRLRLRRGRYSFLPQSLQLRTALKLAVSLPFITDCKPENPTAFLFKTHWEMCFPQ